MKKRAALFAAAIFAAAGTITAYGGWNQDGTGYWYQNRDGSYPSSGVVGIEGKEYLFNDAGYMMTGWQQLGGNWYYFDTASGAKALGWVCVDGTNYYFDPLKSGAMQKGWILLDNSWYYLNESTGGQVNGWLEQGGKWYYMNPANGGVMQTGWLDLNGERYYFEGGVMKTGAFSYGGFMYDAYLSGDKMGALKRNVEETNPLTGDKIRYDQEGKANLWDEDKGRWYTFTEDNANSGFRAGADAMKLREIKYDMYGEYRKTITRSSSQQNKAKESVWEDRVRRKMQGMISEAEIQSYISQVKSVAGSKSKYVQQENVDEEGVWRKEIQF